MRQLLPEPSDDADLFEVYAWPRKPTWVRANMVSSADGSATLEGRSGGLNNAADRDLFALLRSTCDVVLAGASTVRVEGYGPARHRPEFAARRRERGQAPVATMAVVTRTLYLDLASPYFTEAVARPIVVTTSSAPADRRAAAADVADVVIAGDHDVDAGLLVTAFAERGLSRVLCEGGPTLLAHLAAAEQVDDLCLTLSPLLVGADGPRITNGPGIEPPARMRLASLLVDDGYLFCRYITSAGD